MYQVRGNTYLSSVASLVYGGQKKRIIGTLELSFKCKHFLAVCSSLLLCFHNMCLSLSLSLCVCKCVCVCVCVCVCMCVSAARGQRLQPQSSVLLLWRELRLAQRPLWSMLWYCTGDSGEQRWMSAH